VTKTSVKDATKDFVVPGVIVAALIALASQALGLIPRPNTQDEDGFRTRLIAVEARQVDMERQWRQDRNDMMLILMEMKASISRIEGKLER
jgi:hypothetical protein